MNEKLNRLDQRQNGRWFENASDHLDQELENIINWLSPRNFWKTHYGIFEKREKETGSWLLTHPKFEVWLRGSTEVLWCPGDRTFIDE